MRNIRALVVDYGGVLTTPLQDAMVAFVTDIGLELQDFIRIALAPYAGGEDSLITDFETGRISEKEFSTAFALRLGDLTGKEIDPENLVARMFGGVRLEESMLEAVARVRAGGFKTALLSNSWGLDLYPKHRFAQLFDAVVISGEVGLRKPDRAIFDLLLEKLQVEPEACLFVDDHPAHLHAAAELGINTLLHVTPERSIAGLEAALDLDLSG
ncbi:MAG: HAD-IA family hydrolase [Actinobacteria bacterium]|nr:HAD-IA family hydrolase [Actinomycetota bacterium]